MSEEDINFENKKLRYALLQAGTKIIESNFRGSVHRDTINSLLAEVYTDVMNAYSGRSARKNGDIGHLDELIELGKSLLAMAKGNEKLRREVKLLRQYGNNDCTAMADEALND